jgi:hypothetical protein
VARSVNGLPIAVQPWRISRSAHVHASSNRAACGISAATVYQCQREQCGGGDRDPCPPVAADVAPAESDADQPAHREHADCRAGKVNGKQAVEQLDQRDRDRDLAQETEAHHPPPWSGAAGLADLRRSLRLADAEVPGSGCAVAVQDDVTLDAQRFTRATILSGSALCAA